MLCCIKNKESPQKDSKKSSASKENLVEGSNNNGRSKAQPRPEQVNKGFEASAKQGKSAKRRDDINLDQVVLIEGSPPQDQLDPKMAADLSGLISRLEAVTTRLESATTGGGGGGGGGAAGQPEVLSAFVGAFDNLLKGSFAQFMDCCNKIGGDVKTQGLMVQQAFEAQRDFLRKVSLCKQPPQQTLMGLLQPISEKISAIQDYREQNRKSAFFNHLSTISESISSLGWVTVSPTPGPFVKEMADAGQFYSNRVLKEFKEKDKTHVDWCRSWTSSLTELQAYIKQFHTTGITWNQKGVDASTLGGAPSKGGAPPPPPPGPPPPPQMLNETAAPAEDPNENRNALFAELNKGTEITKGLKKVKDSEKTHKNPALRTGPQPFKASPSSSQRSVTSPVASQAVTKPPRCELDGKKWIIEYQKGNKDLVISDTNNKQTVYIFKCEDSTIQVKGKINSITLDNCKKTAIVFENAISSLEMINCQRIQAQVTGKVPTISIDKTDGCQIYLSKDSLKAEIVSAKSSEMNVLVPDSSGEFKEYALPEQFKTIWGGKKFNTTATDING